MKATVTGLDRWLTRACALLRVFSFPENWARPEDHEILRMGLAGDNRYSSEETGRWSGRGWA